MEQEVGLIYFTQARQALHKARTIDEVKDVRDKAERLRLYLKQSKESLEMQNDAAEIGLRAERRAGEMLKESKEIGDRAKTGENQHTRSGSNVVLPPPPTLAEVGISKMQSSRWQAIASIPEAQFEKAIGQAKIAGQELTRSMLHKIAKEQQPSVETEDDFEWDEEKEETPEPEPVKPHVFHNSGNNEWYTPAPYVDAAFEVMGSIDLDPASSAIANEVIQATTFYTAENDGLSKEWRGRVWMNPPYAGELISKFTSKLCEHFNAGDVIEAIVLVNNATETGWFQEMAACASAICFPKGRIKYWRSEGDTSAPLQGQAFLYFGKKPKKFCETFSTFGFGVLL